MKERKEGQITRIQVYLMVAQPHPSLAIGWARPGDPFIQRLIFKRVCQSVANGGNISISFRTFLKNSATAEADRG